jgi:hypothetical protein
MSLGAVFEHCIKHNPGASTRENDAIDDAVAVGVFVRSRERPIVLAFSSISVRRVEDGSGLR